MKCVPSYNLDYSISGKIYLVSHNQLLLFFFYRKITVVIWFLIIFIRILSKTTINRINYVPFWINFPHCVRVSICSPLTIRQEASPNNRHIRSWQFHNANVWPWNVEIRANGNWELTWVTKSFPFVYDVQKAVDRAKVILHVDHLFKRINAYSTLNTLCRAGSITKRLYHTLLYWRWRPVCWSSYFNQGSVVG